MNAPAPWASLVLFSALERMNSSQLLTVGTKKSRNTDVTYRNRRRAAVARYCGWNACQGGTAGAGCVPEGNTAHREAAAPPGCRGNPNRAAETPRASRSPRPRCRDPHPRPRAFRWLLQHRADATGSPARAPADRWWRNLWTGIRSHSRATCRHRSTSESLRASRAAFPLPLSLVLSWWPCGAELSI